MVLWINNKNAIYFFNFFKVGRKNKPKFAHFESVFLFWAYAN